MGFLSLFTLDWIRILDLPLISQLCELDKMYFLIYKRDGKTYPTLDVRVK